VGLYLDKNLLGEMNYRMQRSGLGYKHTGEFLVRVEDGIFFDEVTAPCLSILSRDGFENAKRHFSDAYDELKKQKYDDALTDCGQALESVIKTRLHREGIAYNEHDNLSKLLPIVKSNIVAPDFMQDYLNNLIKVIEGLATWRNKEGPHGKTDGVISNINDTFVRFVLNQAASNVLFLAEVDFRKP
jgi:hypothetical protein